MGLKIWMPLTGNLNNLGTASVTTTVSGTTSYTNGKIGQCLSCNGSSFWTVTGIELGTEASICCWTKTTVNNKMSWVLTATSYTSLNLYESSYYSLNIGDGNNNKFKDSNGGDIACLHDGVWHHFAVTFGSSIAKLYIDGVYRGTAPTFRSPATTSAKTIKIAGGFTGGHQYDWNGGINDFRVYDHCLSPKEVKDISKGLVLHYPLNGYFGNGENLFIGTQNFDGWYLNSRWTKSNGVITYTVGSKAWNDVDSPTIPWTMVQNKDVTISAEIRSDDFNYTDGSGFSICLVRKASGPAAGGYSSRRLEMTPIHKKVNEISKSWTLVTGTVKNITDSSFTNTYNGGGGDWFGIYIWNYTNKGVQIRNIKLEIGSVATPWSPALSDLGIDTTKISDCSGYNNTGTVVGTLSRINDSSRYLTSTYFNGSSVVKDNTFSFTSAQWSVSFWYKFTTRPSAYQGFLCLSRNAGADADKKFAAMPNSTYIWFKFENTTYTLSSLKLNEWCHIVMTCDGTNGKVYENGILKGTTSAISSIYTNCDDFVVGGRATASDASSVGVFLNGYMNDVRIYATTLSAEDVKELYDNPTSIDNLGNIHSFGFNEAFGAKDFFYDYPKWVSTTDPTAVGITYDKNTGLNFRGHCSVYKFGDYQPQYYEIKNAGYTYQYDIEYSNDAGNYFYIGFEKYDANKTATTNDSTGYLVTTNGTAHTNTKISGTVNLSVDVNGNAVKYIKPRILNSWSGSTSGTTHTGNIRYFSLREVPSTGNMIQSIGKNGITSCEQMLENDPTNFHKDGFIETKEFIEK